MLALKALAKKILSGECFLSETCFSQRLATVTYIYSLTATADDSFLLTRPLPDYISKLAAWALREWGWACLFRRARFLTSSEGSEVGANFAQKPVNPYAISLLGRCHERLLLPNGTRTNLPHPNRRDKWPPLVRNHGNVDFAVPPELPFSRGGTFPLSRLCKAHCLSGAHVQDLAFPGNEV